MVEISKVLRMLLLLVGRLLTFEIEIRLLLSYSADTKVATVKWKTLSCLEKVHGQLSDT